MIFFTPPNKVVIEGWEVGKRSVAIIKKFCLRFHYYFKYLVNSYSKNQILMTFFCGKFNTFLKHSLRLFPHCLKCTILSWYLNFITELLPRPLPLLSLTLHVHFRQNYKDDILMVFSSMLLVFSCRYVGKWSAPRQHSHCTVIPLVPTELLTETFLKVCPYVYMLYINHLLSTKTM